MLSFTTIPHSEHKPASCKGAGQGASEGSAEEGWTLSHLTADLGSLGGSQRRTHLH